jgi:DNA-binding transcriptional regulator YdaS (Cro superfamily)
MKYKRHVATGVLAFSLIAGGTSAFAADMNATSTKVNQYSNQVKMKSSTKSDTLDSITTGTSTKKANRSKNKTKTKYNSTDNTIDAKDASGKDIESNDDSVKKTSTSITNKINKVHKKATQKSRPINNPIGSI